MNEIVNFVKEILMLETVQTRPVGLCSFDCEQEVIPKRTVKQKRKTELRLSELMDKYELEYAIVPVGEGEQVYMREDSRYTELYNDEKFAVYKYDAR